MKNRIAPSIFLIIAIFCFAPLLSSAQRLTNVGEPESANVLEFQSKRNSKAHQVEAGGKFAYSLHGSNRIFRGTLDEIRDSSLVISGAEIQLSEFHMMESRDRKKQRKAGGLMIWTLVLSLLGIVGVILAAIYGVQRGPNGGPNGGNSAFVILLIGLALILYLFQILFLVGTFLYTLGRRRFDLKRYWNVQVKPKPTAE